jgi:hypothetical protein
MTFGDVRCSMSARALFVGDIRCLWYNGINGCLPVLGLHRCGISDPRGVRDSEVLTDAPVSDMPDLLPDPYPQ